MSTLTLRVVAGFYRQVTAGFSDEVTFEQKPKGEEAMHRDNSDNNNKTGVGKGAYLKLLNYLKIYYLIYKGHLLCK